MSMSRMLDLQRPPIRRRKCTAGVADPTLVEKTLGLVYLRLSRMADEGSPVDMIQDTLKML